MEMWPKWKKTATSLLVTFSYHQKPNQHRSSPDPAGFCTHTCVQHAHTHTHTRRLGFPVETWGRRDEVLVCPQLLFTQCKRQLFSRLLTDSRSALLQIKTLKLSKKHTKQYKIRAEWLFTTTNRKPHKLLHCLVMGKLKQKSITDQPWEKLIGKFRKWCTKNNLVCWTFI